MDYKYKMMNIKSENNRENDDQSNSSAEFAQEFASTYPIDLSCRRDSVESRKTPSPYSTSNFGSDVSSIVQRTPPSRRIRQVHGSGLLEGVAFPSITPRHLSQRSIYYPFPAALAGQSLSNQQSLIAHMEQHQMGYRNDGEIASQAIQEDTFQRFFHEATTLRNLDEKPMDECIPSTPTFNSYPTEKPSDCTYPLLMGRDGKMTRPFKAYPRDPSTISSPIGTFDALVERESADQYQQFRHVMLTQIQAANGGQRTVSNPKMRRNNVKCVSTLAASSATHSRVQDDTESDETTTTTSQNGDHTTKDSAYLERRKKNNAAAKKSRDRRRIKEDEIAIRAAYLERENLKLKCALAAQQNQLNSPKPYTFPPN